MEVRRVVQQFAPKRRYVKKKPDVDSVIPFENVVDVSPLMPI